MMRRCADTVGATSEDCRQEAPQSPRWASVDFDGVVCRSVDGCTAPGERSEGGIAEGCGCRPHQLVRAALARREAATAE